MARVTKSMVPEEPRRLRLPRPRVPRPGPLRGFTAPFLVLLVLVAVYAPDVWMRIVTTAAVLYAAYLAGARDGRRDLALDLLRGRPDDRTTERPPSRGEEPEP